MNKSKNTKTHKNKEAKTKTGKSKTFCIISHIIRANQTQRTEKITI